MSNAHPVKRVQKAAKWHLTPDQMRAAHAGRNPESIKARRQLFVEAYIANGHNATQAAIASGSSGKYSRVTGVRMLSNPITQQMIAERAGTIAQAAELSTANWATELRAIAFSRAGDLVDAAGKPLPVHLLPTHVQAAIASVDIDALGATKYKFWSKVAALEIVAKHLGLFERDNAQKVPDVRVNVVLMG